MNKGYILIDGKAMVSDENGNYKEMDYKDNIDEILVEENVIEKMNDKIEKLENILKNKKERKRFIPISLIDLLLAYIAMSAVVFALFGTNPFVSNIDTIFGSVKEFYVYLVAISVVAIPAFGIGFIKEYVDYKDDRAKYNALKIELDFLKSKIEKEKVKLETLRNAETKSNNLKGVTSSKVDDKEALEESKRYFELYRDLGFNLDKFNKYYKRGVLEDKLSKFDEEFATITKEYYEENGPKLIKKR